MTLLKTYIKFSWIFYGHLEYVLNIYKYIFSLLLRGHTNSDNSLIICRREMSIKTPVNQQHVAFMANELNLTSQYCCLETPLTTAKSPKV